MDSTKGVILSNEVTKPLGAFFIGIRVGEIIAMLYSPAVAFPLFNEVYI